MKAQLKLNRAFTILFFSGGLLCSATAMAEGLGAELATPLPVGIVSHTTVSPEVDQTIELVEGASTAKESINNKKAAKAPATLKADSLSEKSKPSFGTPWLLFRPVWSKPKTSSYLERRNHA